MNPSPRGHAIRVLAEWLKTGAFPDRLIGDGVPDRALVMEIVLGVVRYRRLLRWIVDRYVVRAPDNLGLAGLLAGCYQILRMDRIPDHASVNETVAAVGRRAGTAGLLNAVLRRVSREREQIQREIRRLPLAVRESHPDELVDRWVSAFGPEATEALCRWNNTPAEVNIRVTERADGADAFRNELLAAGIETAPHSADPEHFLVLPRGCRVSRLPGYDDGRFIVQDPATCAAVRLLDVREGHRVLDACAAPGGKTVLIAEQLGKAGHLVALDLHEDRIGRLRENLARAGYPDTEVMQGDAARLSEETMGSRPFDRILLDVPCTNTGVIRRRPDARWRFSSKRLEVLTRSQQRILAHAAGLLAPGGILVYSTCSLEREENEAVVRNWLEAGTGFALLREWRSVPPNSRMDGAYAAAVRRQ